MNGLLLSFGHRAKSIQSTDEESQADTGEEGDDDEEKQQDEAIDALFQAIKDDDREAAKAALQLFLSAS